MPIQSLQSDYNNLGGVTFALNYTSTSHDFPICYPEICVIIVGKNYITGKYVKIAFH